MQIVTICKVLLACGKTIESAGLTQYRGWRLLGQGATRSIVGQVGFHEISHLGPKHASVFCSATHHLLDSSRILNLEDDLVPSHRRRRARAGSSSSASG